MIVDIIYLQSKFLLTRPMRDVTYHPFFYAGSMSFLLTRPMRDVTAVYRDIYDQIKFLLTRPMRDVTYGWI